LLIPLRPLRRKGIRRKINLKKFPFFETIPLLVSS